MREIPVHDDPGYAEGSPPFCENRFSPPTYAPHTTIKKWRGSDFDAAPPIRGVPTAGSASGIYLRAGNGRVIGVDRPRR
jgi:hypothetical protein